MGAWLELLSITFTIFCALRPTNAGDLDVIPQESVVPQCSLLTVRWGQTHLHVQPEALINVTNLVDLGVQDGTSTTFQARASPLHIIRSQISSPSFNSTHCPGICVRRADVNHKFKTAVPPRCDRWDCMQRGRCGTYRASSSLEHAPAFCETASGPSSLSKSPSPEFQCLFWTHNPYTRIIDYLIQIIIVRALAAYPGAVATLQSTRNLPMTMVSSNQSSSTSGHREKANFPASATSSQQTLLPKIDDAERIKLGVDTPATPSAATPSPRIHTDAGVRICDPDELPPIYHDYRER
ncbi:hypothetical protein B0H10DRAFT_1957317 [Mycena sp. CBHHK59/15]|nr:hypothetical protein B0H10DRAFT_1957317 [Mycena sp. CBHHK59/15]